MRVEPLQPGDGAHPMYFQADRATIAVLLILAHRGTTVALKNEEYAGSVRKSIEDMLESMGLDITYSIQEGLIP